jgi:hypothetical protein
MWSLGIPSMFAGIFLNTAPNFFYTEMVPHLSFLGSVSILFQASSFGYVGPILIVAGFIGAAVASLTMTG